MDFDFSGYASKAGLKCADGRTILPDAFAHQDKMRVPLVWHHGHKDVENVLGHVDLENRADGVYCYGYFNNTTKAKHSAQCLEHGDFDKMSIWANDLVERAGQVMHGQIREVSLTLAGANPGAVIDVVNIRHSNGDEFDEDETLIFSELQHDEDSSKAEGSKKEASGDSETIQDVIDTMNVKQQTVLYHMVEQALEAGDDADEENTDDDKSDDKKSDDDENPNIKHSDLEGDNMSRSNVFDKQNDKTDDGPNKAILTHDAMKGILAHAMELGSLDAAIKGFISDTSLQHGITDIGQLFPEAKELNTTPEFYARRMEWVNDVLGGVRRSPFSRVRTTQADITMDSARALGYIKGNMKKEEFFSLLSRTTEPTTIYKKQKLDRDDVLDITDFDVITWIKGEMRIMLDEEIARAIIIGDGRPAEDPANPGSPNPDRINPTKLRPIATEDPLYAVPVEVDLPDGATHAQVIAVLDKIVESRALYRGSGSPTLFTTESFITKALLLRDTVGRKLYRTLQELQDELRMSKIVPVEVMEGHPEIVAVMVNLADYQVGADKGGAITMFDDFDIDFNQEKFLIETRISGALIKLRSALVFKNAETEEDEEG